MSVTIEHLQSQLVVLLEQVRNERREDPTLRAEVLIAMNQLCSAGMLLGLWQTLETVGPREEILLVRLLRDLESARLEEACAELIANPDEIVRSVGYGVVALRSRLAGAALVVRAFGQEPGIVLKRGGRRHLAPHSFVTCMLAGIREFKDAELDRICMEALTAFSRGASDLEVITQLLDDARPSVARLGFVSLCSRFMGKLHRFAYERVVSAAPWRLTKRQRRWMAHALELAPEVIEAIAEPGPVGVGGPDFVRARVFLLRDFVKRDATERIDDLMRARTQLRSVVIERRLGQADKSETTGESQMLRARAIAYLFAALIGDRRGLGELVDGLAKDGELEHAMVDRLVELGGEHGALNLATSLVVHWLQLPDGDPLRRWIDGLWTDDRHTAVADAVAAALQRPDETAVYAAKVVATLGSPTGALTRALRGGHALDLGDLQEHLKSPRLVPLCRAVLIDDVELHPNAVVTLARAGLVDVSPAIRARLRRENDPQLQSALERARVMLDAERVAAGHPVYRTLAELGLWAADREILLGAPAADVIERELPTGAGLFRVYFWLPGTQLPNPVGARPATGYAAVGHFVVSGNGEVLEAGWVDRSGVAHERVALGDPPDDIRDGFRGIPWGTPLENLSEAVDAAGGRVLATVPVHSAIATRTLVALDGAQMRLETDEHGRLCEGVTPLKTRTIDEAVELAVPHFGPVLFRTATQAVWRYRGLEAAVRRDPAFEAFVRTVRVVAA